MKHKNGINGSDLKRACANSLVSLLTLLLLSLLFGKLIDAGLIRMELLPVCACAICGLSALAGCVLTALRAGKKALLYALVTAGLFYALLFCGNLLLRDRELRSPLPTLLCVLAAAMLGSLLGAGRRSRRLR